MKRPIFWNDSLNAQFIEDGYVVVPFADAALLAEMQEAYGNFKPDDGFDPESAKTNELNTSTYHCTYLDTNLDYKKGVQRLVGERLKPAVDDLLKDYSLITANFNVKPPGKGAFHIHQNWPVTDFRHTNLTVWVPLQDTTAENGTLHVVPRSHKILPEIATALSPAYFSPFENELISDYLKPVDVKLGEAAIFCDSLIHNSPANRSSAPRIAIQIELYPSEARLVFYHLNKDRNEFDVYQITPDFFADHSIEAALNPQQFVPKIDSVPNPNRLITRKEFDFRLAQGPKTRNQFYDGTRIVFEDYPPIKKEGSQRIPFLKKLGRAFSLKS